LSIRRAFEAATRVQPDAREDRLPQAFVSLGLFGEDGGVDLIAKMLGQDDEISGKELSESLVHQHGMTPDVAFQAVTAVVMQTDAELEWSPGCEVFPIVTKASLGLVEWEAGLLFRIKALRSHPTESWDAALPFIRVIYGDAVGEDESPIAAQAIALKNALTTLQIRLTLTSAVQERLAAATGGVFAPDVEALTLLARLASATSWQDFLGIARTEVDHVSELTEALSRFEKMRRLAAHALDIEWVLRYLVEAEASLLESASLVAARSLVSRVDAEALIERPALWLAIMGSFDQWRTDYRRSYLQAHSARQLQERKLGSMVDSTGHDVTTTRSYSRFIELPDIQLLELLTRWEQVSRTASPCDAEPEALTLIRSPFCRQCRMQMSSAADCSELEIVSAEITSVLERFTEKLSALAVDDVLTDRRTNEIERLLKLRGVADLSALDGVLGARLSEFLSGYLSRGSDSKPA
jgi:hypothetical protein